MSPFVTLLTSHQFIHYTPSCSISLKIRFTKYTYIFQVAYFRLCNQYFVCISNIIHPCYTHRLIHIPSPLQSNNWVNNNYKVYTKQLAAFSFHILPVRSEDSANQTVHNTLPLESSLNTKLINHINVGQKGRHVIRSKWNENPQLSSSVLCKLRSQDQSASPKCTHVSLVYGWGRFIMLLVLSCEVY